MIEREKRRSFSSRLFTGLTVALLFALVATPLFAADNAAEPVTDKPTNVASVEAIQADDGGNWEIGIEGSAGNLTAATAAERYGMRYWLEGLSNWQVNYDYNETWAWEEDFKRQDLGGTNESYLDSVDLAFYVGHGYPYGFTFDNASHDDSTLSANDCQGAWGNKDNDWVALTSCQVLADANLSGWAQCLNGTHLIMGFVTNANAYNWFWDTQAYHFGRYVRYNYSMPQAWYAACDVAQRGRITRSIINELDCLNDRPNYGQVCADSYDSDWWYQTHYCGTETAIQVPTAQLQGQMPVYQVKPYSLADAENDFSNLGSVFNIPVEETLQSASVSQADPFLVSDALSRTLSLDTSSGLYSYADTGELWTAQQAITALSVNASSANYISQDDAQTIADRFLTANNLNGPGAQFSEVISDLISSDLTTGVVPTSPLGISAAQQVSDVVESPVVWQVIYARRLNANVVTAAGVQQVEFSVVGPGAKQKVYVPVAAPVGAASVLQTAPIGLQAGWRDVEQPVNAATGQAVMVDIFSEDQVKALFEALPYRVSLNDIPIEIADPQVISSTVAYWEDPQGVSQAQLTPVYELLATYTEVQGGATGQDYFYVPASELYMRPYAEIISGAPTAAVNAGDKLTLTAADASKTLKELGAGDFDFVLGNGTYLYDWYINVVSDATKVGSGQTLSDFVVPANPDGRGGSLSLVLQVTDLNSPNEGSNKATASVTIQVNPSVFLPLVGGNDAN